MIPDNAREILENALFEAKKVLMSHWGNTHKATVKESISSVVTEADLAAERTILEVLGQSTEPCNILSEESGYTDRGSEYTWVVDPLDGTSNFAAGLPWFGVIITLMQKGEAVLAGMNLPVENESYLAEKGKGVWKSGVQIRTSSSPVLKDQLVAYSFDYNPDPRETAFEMQLMASLSAEVRNIRSTNSLFDFCYVSDGRLGAAINQATKIWDIAAPSLIIQEAGGVVTDIQGAELSFDLSPSGMKRNYTIVAAAAGIHQPLMRILKSKNSL